MEKGHILAPPSGLFSKKSDGQNMKAIVTGSSGFIGSRLCYFLRQQGHSVIKVSRTAKLNAKTDLQVYIEVRICQKII